MRHELCAESTKFTSLNSVFLYQLIIHFQRDSTRGLNSNYADLFFMDYTKCQTIYFMKGVHF